MTGPRIPSRVAHALRFGFGALVIWLLIRAGALDPELIGAALTKHPGLCLLAFALYLVPLQILAWLRWHWLLRAAKVRISWRASARLHLMGLFFNGFLPGGTGGDLVKGWYLLKGRTKPAAAAALGTLVVDRVAGLFGLIALAAATNWVGREAWAGSPVLAAQSLFLFALAGGMVMLTAAYLSPWTPRLPLLRGRAKEANDAEEKPRGFLAEFGLALASFRRQPRVFLGAVAISSLVHFLLVLVYALGAAALDVELPFRMHAYVAPVLTLANGIPVSPAGLGVGEAAGMVLYKAAGASHGFAEIPALVHAVGIAAALSSAPAYLFRKK